MTDDCLPEEAEDGGDTTDTLDDTDHVGLVRFGIEAIDKDDEDTEEALQLAMRDRTLVDARNMGLSISIDALAEQPELVVAKTARSLGVSSETAAKILTSVGMSLLMNSGGDSSTGQSSLQRKQERRERKSRIAPKLAQTERDAGAAPSASTSAVTIEEQAQPSAEQAPMKYVPVLGDFEPAGEADLCVVVGQSEMPAPSPFSARKKRRPRTFVSADAWRDVGTHLTCFPDQRIPFGRLFRSARTVGALVRLEPVLHICSAAPLFGFFRRAVRYRPRH